MRRTRRQQFHLAGALHVEEQDAGAKRQIDFQGQLSDARKDDFRFDLAAGFGDRLQLAPGNDVEPRAQAGKQAQDRKIRVRLHRVTDGVLAAVKRLVELLEALVDCRTRIDVERRVVESRQPGEWNVVCVQFNVGFAQKSLIASVGEPRWAFRWSVSFHFLADGPFTLMATMVWSSNVSTPSAWLETALKMASTISSALRCALARAIFSSLWRPNISPSELVASRMPSLKKRNTSPARPRRFSSS